MHEKIALVNIFALMFSLKDYADGVCEKEKDHVTPQLRRSNLQDRRNIKVPSKHI